MGCFVEGDGDFEGFIVFFYWRGEVRGYRREVFGFFRLVRNFSFGEERVGMGGVVVGLRVG